MDTGTNARGWIKNPVTNEVLGNVAIEKISDETGRRLFTVRVTSSQSPKAPVGARFAVPMKFIGGWTCD